MLKSQMNVKGGEVSVVGGGRPFALSLLLSRKAAAGASTPQTLVEEWLLEWKGEDEFQQWRSHFLRAGCSAKDLRDSGSSSADSSLTLEGSADSSSGGDFVVEPAQVLAAVPVTATETASSDSEAPSSTALHSSSMPAVPATVVASATTASPTFADPASSVPLHAPTVEPTAAATGGVAMRRPTSLGRRSSLGSGNDNLKEGYLSVSNDDAKTWSPRFASLNCLSGLLQLSAEKSG